MDTLKIGSYVKSIKGRDKGNVYIVKKIFEKKVELVDGCGKTNDKPKQKNVKHIEVLGNCSNKIGTKFTNGNKVFDEEIYSAIKKIKNK